MGRITIDPADLDLLREFLRAVHVQVTVVGPGVLEACVPNAPSRLHEERELAAYVTTFNALHPGCRAALTS